MLDGLEPVPIETVDKVLLSYFADNAWLLEERFLSESDRRAELNRLCANSEIKTIDNKTFKTIDGRVLAP